MCRHIHPLLGAGKTRLVDPMSPICCVIVVLNTCAVVRANRCGKSPSSLSRATTVMARPIPCSWAVMRPCCVRPGARRLCMIWMQGGAMPHMRILYAW